MKYFTCLLRYDGQPVTEKLRSRHLSAGSLHDSSSQSWLTEGCFAAIAEALYPGLGPSVARLGPHVAAGDVRLDNRADVARLSGSRSDSKTDLELVLAAIVSRGARCVPELLGDFAFVVWNGISREVVAARDAFGLRALFYREYGDHVAFSSRASLLGRNGDYNLAFIADVVITGSDPTEPSPFAGVTTVPSGCMLEYRGRHPRISEYWSPHGIEINPAIDMPGQVNSLRALFGEAVKLRLTGNRDTWCLLSGGLDSSSVACMSHALVKSGLVGGGVAGTLTVVDTLGDGDEREFSDSVIRWCKLRNHQAVDFWMWQDDGEPPPLSERPSAGYPLYARDRHLCRSMLRRNGRVLLTGVGGDQCLSSSPYYVADWLAQGQWRRAYSELLRWAVVTRQSLWHLAVQNAVIPLLPATLRRWWLEEYARIPPWIRPAFAQAYDMEHRLPVARFFDAPRGRKFAGAVASTLAHFGTSTDVSLYDEFFDFRHPFLYRPLVEFCLQLAPELRSRPFEQKWVLRQALRGVLPEAVRRRTGKGGMDSRVAWSLTRERERVNDLTNNSVLAQLGCVDDYKLRAAIDEVRNGRTSLVAWLFDTLSLETWLRVRSGRWTVRESAPPRAKQLASQQYVS